MSRDGLGSCSHLQTGAVPQRSSESRKELKDRVRPCFVFVQTGRPMRAGPHTPAENHDNEKLNGLFLAQLQEVGGELSNVTLQGEALK